MNITITAQSYRPQTVSVQQLLMEKIEASSDYIDGQVESAIAEARHAHRSLCTLIDLLASKGVLTAPEVVQIACHYEADPDATFAP